MSRAVGTSQVRFIRDAAIRGEPLTLNYSGAWTRNPATGVVSATTVVPSSVNVNGFMTTGVLPSPFFDERLKKWGSSFSSNAAALLPINASTANLSSITCMRTGDVYTVIVVAPDELSGYRFHTVLLRRAAIFNKIVQVSIQSMRDDTSTTLFTNLPCRISFPPASMQAGLTQVDSAGILAVAKPSLECPFIYEGAGTAGAGIEPAITAGSVWTMEPKITEVIDDPSLYSGPGLKVHYQIASLNMDPGGDLHHQRYILGVLQQ